jgi:hypothetical protein
MHDALSNNNLSIHKQSRDLIKQKTIQQQKMELKIRQKLKKLKWTASKYKCLPSQSQEVKMKSSCCTVKI